MVRDALGETLRNRQMADLEKILRVRGALLERALVSSREFVSNRQMHMPAWQRYSGVVWEHLDPRTLSKRSRSQVLVPSGLYGLHSAEDAIADYRLTMHASLDGLGNLARFWRPYLTAIVESYRPRTPMVNLLPTEHARAFDFTKRDHVIEVQFLTADGTGAAGHAAKAVKGRFARHLLDNGLDDVAAFRFDGWKVTSHQSGFVLRSSN